jgi:FMN phosphatase YigB (HAD superfamily)
MFRRALAGFSALRPVQTAHVGDTRRTDVAGAQRAGMQAFRCAVLVDDRDEAYPSGDLVFHSYDQLLGALGV